MRPSLILLPVVLLAACAPAGSGQSPATRDGTDGGRASGTLIPATVQPSPAASTPGVITGRLGADAVEGGCGYLEAEDGTRYEVVWPDGWQLSTSPLELRDPDGAVVARTSDELTVRGQEATDMASICQMGPIFQAVEVVTTR